MGDRASPAAAGPGAVAGPAADGWRAGTALAAGVSSVLVVVLPLVYGSHWLGVDGDPGRHIRVGETILRSGLFYRDPFSFTHPGAPFVPYEWLSEVLTALSVRVAGLPGLLVLTATVLALTYGAVAYTLRRSGVGAIGTALTLLFVMAVSSVHWNARPHVFTFLGAALLMVLVDRTRDAPARAGVMWRPAALALILFALWANTHGGVLYGLCVLGAIVTGDALETIAAAGPDRHVWLARLRRDAVLLGAAVLGTVCTPSGPALAVHAVRYLGDRYLLSITEEYWSPNFHKLQLAGLLIVLTVLVLALLPRRASFPALGVVILNLAFSLVAVRNLPLFAIVALPIVASEVEHAWGRPPGRARRGRGGGVSRPLSARGRVRVVAAALAPAAACAAMLAIGRGSAAGAASATLSARLPTTFDAGVFPVRSVRQARAAGLTGRVFHELMWGGYILYAWPEQQVFIDGQTDFYGDSLTRDYMAIHDLGPGWRGRLAAWRIDVAVIPTDGALADALAHEAGWRAAYCDSTATIFVREGSHRPELAPMASLPEQCATIGDRLRL